MAVFRLAAPAPQVISSISTADTVNNICRGSRHLCGVSGGNSLLRRSSGVAEVSIRASSAGRQQLARGSEVIRCSTAAARCGGRAGSDARAACEIGRGRRSNRFAVLEKAQSLVVRGGGGVATCQVTGVLGPLFTTWSSSCVSQGRSFRHLHVRSTATGPRSDMDTAAADVNTLEVAIKSATGRPDLVGDCPFSHRVTLTLEEKGIKYSPILIDTSNKPEWFLEANPAGKVPVLKYQGKWVPESDVIVGILEKEFPEPSLAVPEEKATVGSKIFPAFMKFLKSKDPADGSEDALLEELNKFEEYLSKEGPFINGEKVSAADMSLIPKLYHLHVALKHFKGWTIPEDLVHVHAYIKAAEGRESFKKTAAPEEYVIKGWEKHMAQ